VSQTRTITPAITTQAGIILGTAAYMGPEQAKGKPADRRSDIWAFGCVLYEMLTGTRAFDGGDVGDTLAAILRAEPDWSSLPAATPLPIRKLLARSLQKDRRDRLADIADATFEIVDAQRGAPHDRSAVAGPSWSQARIHLAWVGAAGILAFGVGFGVNHLRQALPAAATIRFAVQPPEGWTKPLDNSLGPASATSVALSPDGRHLAFLARNDSGHTSLWIRALDQFISRQLPGTEDALGPFWSPDSRYVAFFAISKLKKVDISGSVPTTICETSSFNGGTWGVRDIIVFAPIAGTAREGSRGLMQVPATGGVPRPATDLHEDEPIHIRPAFLPDGRHFLYRATIRQTLETSGSAR
jgi:eukaryotic-like serine/threonine-protein kinase